MNLGSNMHIDGQKHEQGIAHSPPRSHKCCCCTSIVDKLRAAALAKSCMQSWVCNQHGKLRVAHVCRIEKQLHRDGVMCGLRAVRMPMPVIVMSTMLEVIISTGRQAVKAQ